MKNMKHMKFFFCNRSQFSSARSFLQPEGLIYLSPGQRPGFKFAAGVALKGQHNSLLILPFQGVSYFDILTQGVALG